MRILLPCRRLAYRNASGGRAVPASLRLRSNEGSSTISPAHWSHTVLPSQRRRFTLPDLSSIGSALSGSGDSSKGDEYHETVMMPYSKEALFDIVSDVDGYSDFVPYCVGSKVKPSSEKRIDNGTREFLADLAIGYGQFQESYTSKVTIVDGKSVQATAIPTPLFKRLETEWIFTQQSPQSTKVDFTIHYSFSNPLYAAFAKTAMEKMTAKMVDAFKKRAEEQKQS